MERRAGKPSRNRKRLARMGNEPHDHEEDEEQHGER